MRKTRQVVVGLGLLSIDQMTKYGAGYFGSVRLNAGVSLSFLETVPPFLLSMGSAFLLGILVYTWYTAKTRTLSWGLVALIAGGSANLVDRVWFGAVRDWLPMPLLGGKNNIADWILSIGVFGIIVALLRMQESSIKVE